VHQGFTQGLKPRENTDENGIATEMATEAILRDIPYVLTLDS
jgi:hypothetical protein